MHFSPESIFQTLSIALAVGGGVAFLFHRLKLSPVLAFIVAGVLLGPSGLNLIRDMNLTEALSQIGLVFLLFMIGLELHWAYFQAFGLRALWAGLIQLGGSTILLTLCLTGLGVPWALSLLLASCLALSSTALVLKGLESEGIGQTLQGRLILAILLLQDLAIIPLMAVVSSLTGGQLIGGGFFAMASILGWATLKAALVLGASISLSRWVIPKLLDSTAKTKNRELFTLLVAVIALGMATFTGSLGLSFEAGAFIAGVALSGSVFSHQLVADSRPFRDVFTAVFFMSVGLMLDAPRFIQEWPLVLLMTAGIILTKGVAAGVAMTVLQRSFKTFLWGAVSLFQVGEFSLVLLHRTLSALNTTYHTAQPLWLIQLNDLMPSVINAVVISLFLTPLLINRLPKWVYRKNLPETDSSVENTFSPSDQVASNPLISFPQHVHDHHVIIAGHGPVAQHLREVLEMKCIPYVVVELNVNTVNRLQEKGVPVLFGDISQEAILKAAGIEKATVLALTFPDIRLAQVALQTAKRLNPGVICMARSRFYPQVDALYRAGAEVVVYEEFEASISFLFNTLTLFKYPLKEIQNTLMQFRQMEMHRIHGSASVVEQALGRMNVLGETNLEWIEIKADSPWVGKTLAELDLRQRFGVTVLSMIYLDGTQITNPDPNIQLTERVVLVVLGSNTELSTLEKDAAPLLETPLYCPLPNFPPLH